MTTRTQIVETALAYIGTPFRHQGRAKGIGVDCIGLVVCVARDLGLTKGDAPHAYGRTPRKGDLQAGLNEHLLEIDKDSTQPGDIVLMSFLGEPMHVGIITDYGIVHAYQGVGKCVHHRLDTKWANRIVTAYRYPNVEE